MTRYTGYSKEELLLKLRQANEALDRGSVKVVGMQPGVRHEFYEKTDTQLRQIIREIQKALWELDPDTYTNPDTAKVMRVRSDFSGGYFARAEE